MNREVRFTDLFGMPERSDIYTDANNILEDLYSSTNAPSLRVTIKATHSGYLLNNRVYPGSGVKAGASSWVSKDNGGTAGYDKPFLKHHDSKSEPIGRIDAQKFVQLWEDDLFKNDWKNPDHGTKPGSGYIVISGTVSDKDAQQKILDGRYKTVSTGQSSNKAYCSICGHDWLSDTDEEEVCNHRPGRVYDLDGVKYRAYLVTGKMKYMECSFVNHPANELAGILSADFDSAIVPESKEQTVEVVTADTLGGVCSIVLADSEGRVTELIRSPDDKDEIPYGQDNAKRAVRVAVPEGFDMDKDGSRSKKLDWPKSLVLGDANANYNIEEMAASIKNMLKHEVIKELAGSSLTSNSKINTDKQSGELNDPESGKDAQNIMSTKKEDEIKDTDVAKNTDDTDKPLDRTVVVLEKALEDSQSRTAELEAELAKAKQLYDTKISEYNCLMDENAAITEEFKKQLASQLVTMQMQLHKPQVKSVADHQSFGEAVTHVAARSVESLRDSIEDLVPELASSFKSNGLPSFIKDRVEEKPPVAKSVKEENVSTIKKTDIDPMDQI